MKTFLILLAFFALFSSNNALVCETKPSLKINNRPVIGVLAQRYWGSFKQYSKGYSYIAASYVKYLESAGARVVPIFVSEDYEYYKKLMKQINGLLLPGGNNYVGNSEYSDAALTLWKLSIQANTNDDYFPVWGTCLGFEMILFAQANQTDYLTKCESNDVALPLNFTRENIQNSKMFAEINPQLLKILKNEKVTVNYHHNCMTYTNFTKARLDEFFDVLSTNEDVTGLQFISTIEAKKYPIYGVQFHPEKNAYEFIVNSNHRNTPHSFNSILTTQYFANFFVNETRKNFHCFKTQLAENKALIYNFNTEFTGISGKGSFDELYFFKISPSTKTKSSFIISVLLCLTNMLFTVFF
ncbi:gamma-glutamyl hydrolase A-like isoform X1 [Leptotrombidium deliense]|uniref:folate gamma-glutamyl hydrolase n=1 Tax=Leptotrombidium deliense TaxID=299467 RepID=A0A443SHZ9_9ACAR|nr:gamma-glutamyl hydrolase A-like isoform X1 [Leptotrombidium deliense]